ncbi:MULTISPECIES: FMN-binding protein [unclassified Arthrobacter]|uniref:FMN-binding protein n=1 Tax=unclassified Arthrobacter TaxID=235627 RepID=UPI001C862499|nr:FMN-binding protein [Arthrobacter sp. MAHUQ-56]MBX7443042.1 FMN-binding protein [Arthrobacter sp. MAHUQ-56]
MKIRGAVAAALASAGILLAGWQAGTQVHGISTVTSSTTATGTKGSTGTGSPGTGSTGTGTTGSVGSSGTGSSGTSNSSASGTYTGTAVQTRFGAVQVQITVSNGKITEVTPLQLTDTDGRSIQISNRAAPLLRTKVLAAQSANVQTVSGATVTSRAYLTSLQAAIDAANL